MHCRDPRDHPPAKPLEPADMDAWLAGGAGAGLLKPAANEILQKWPVSRRVNSSRTSDEDATLIDWIEVAAVAG
jgi:putative SOS response-associated peptidase YedK